MRRPVTLITSIFSVNLALLAGEPPQDLADQSLEQLMSIKVVSVGKKAESLKTTAASVFVITSEDIRRSGMHSLPEVLRLAPGVQVARDLSGHWAVSIRGFNGDFANKLLVLVDGREVYNAEWAGVFWDMEEIPLDDIERIEVVRGPGAAMWGPNAVNGVINILSKPAQETPGGMVSSAVGNTATNSSARYGGTIGPDASYRITGMYGNSEAMPSGSPAPFTPSNGWTNTSGNLRLDWKPDSSDTAFFTAQAYQSSLGDPVTFLTPQNPHAATQNELDESFSGSVLMQWDHQFDNGSSLEGRVSWEHMDHDPHRLPLAFTAIDSQVQYHFSLGSWNDIVAGAEYREQSFFATATPGATIDPVKASDDSISSFLEDRATLVADRLFFIAGVNVGHFAIGGLKAQPTGRLLWTPTAKLTTWAAVSRAIRTPSLIEGGLNDFLGSFNTGTQLPGLELVTGNPNAQSESVLSYEAGQRIEAGQRVSLDLSAFWNRYDHLLYYTPGAPVFVSGPNPYIELPIGVNNAFSGRSHGMEASATWNAATHWRWTGGFSWLDVSVQSYPGWPPPISSLNNAPAFQWQLRSSLDLTRHLQLDTALYYTGAIGADSVPQHLRGDLRIGWRPNDSLEFSTGVQDAFERYHAELPSQYQNQQYLVERNVYGAFTWRF